VASKVLVSGANGYIASHTVAQLLDRGTMLWEPFASLAITEMRTCSLLRWPAKAIAYPCGRRHEQAGIEPQSADQGCPLWDGMGRFLHGKAAVAHEDDAPLGQPAAQLQRPLPGLVGQHLVTASGLQIGPLGWRQQGQDRQGLDQPGPRRRCQHHEAEPA
jgi:hypothetical protein